MSFELRREHKLATGPVLFPQSAEHERKALVAPGRLLPTTTTPRKHLHWFSCYSAGFSFSSGFVYDQWEWMIFHCPEIR
jgi:hypothetical protein